MSPPAGTEEQGPTGDLANKISLAFAGAVALLGSLGAATGGSARLQRNGGWWVWLALVFLLGAAAVGLIGAMARSGRAKPLLVTGAVLTVAAIALSAVASWNLAQQRDRPRLSATWQSTDDPLVLRVTATATGVGVDDQLTVLVLAPARGFTYYFGHTGPDGDGKAQQIADVFIPRDSDVDAIQVSASVGDVFATCQGEAFSRADLERGALKPTSQRVRAACLVIKAVPAPELAS